MAYALLIKDEEENIIVSHVDMEADNEVYVPNAKRYGLHEIYSKAYRLVNDVKDKHPNWTIQEKIFDAADLF